MKVTGLFNIKKLGTIVSGVTPWRDYVGHKNGDIISCGNKQWKVTAVDSIFEGCFGEPKERHHGLRLDPIDHNEQPNVGDELI